jgi:hypothetical protein
MALRCIVLLIFFNLPLCHGLCKALPFFAVHPPKNLQQFCAKITKILSRNWIQFYRVLLVLCIVIHAASFLVDCGTVAPHFAPSHHIKKKVRHHSWPNCITHFVHCNIFFLGFIPIGPSKKRRRSSHKSSLPLRQPLKSFEWGRRTETVLHSHPGAGT